MDDLQFQKAEYSSSTPPCAVCKTELSGDYYRLHPPAKPARPGMPPAVALDLCPDCAAKLREFRQPPDAATFGRGLLYGGGMALLCGIAYSIFTAMTNYQVGLVSILVGYLVGRAFRTGTRGRGGRRCQIAAVTLTYLAMTLSYAPLIVKQLRDSKSKQESSTSPDPQTKQPTAAPAAGSRPVDIGQYALGFALLAGISLVSPFLDLLSGFSGLLGLFIISIGLQRAWALTAADPRTLAGPFSRGSDSLLPAGDASLV